MLNDLNIVLRLSRLISFILEHKFLHSVLLCALLCCIWSICYSAAEAHWLLTYCFVSCASNSANAMYCSLNIYDCVIYTIMSDLL